MNLSFLFPRSRGSVPLPGLRRRDTPPAYRFHLLRNFTIVSLGTFLLATIVLTRFYRQQATADVIALAEQGNVTLAQVFMNSLWPRYGEFLTETAPSDDRALVADPRTQTLRADLVALIDDLAIEKVKFFNLEGRTIFSTDFGQIGADKSQSEGFLAAKQGAVVSQLEHRDTFPALEDTLTNRKLFSSYVPVSYGGQSVGVLEIYADVTPLVAKISQTERTLMSGLLAILLASFAILLIFIYQANRIIQDQYRKLEDSETAYRFQAEELESVLLELKQTQAQMLQREKMSSLGQLVAGIAHEINNPVSFIYGNCEHLGHYIQDLLHLLQLYRHHYPNPITDIQTTAENLDLPFLETDLPKTLASMKTGSQRIREIVLALRIFSRLDESELKSVNLHLGLDSTLMILNHRLQDAAGSRPIAVVKTYGPLPTVECYAGLLNQVFMHILLNAIEALEQSPPPDQTPQITLCTRLVHEADRPWAEVTIADNGPGIAPEVQPHIFDPFFTTKPIGKGTGLGMSTSYQIISQQHQGQLSCTSAPGEGTTFTLRVPVTLTAHPNRSDSLDPC